MFYQNDIFTLIGLLIRTEIHSSPRFLRDVETLHMHRNEIHPNRALALELYFTNISTDNES